MIRRTCPSCGKLNPGDVETCACGKPLPPPPASPEPTPIEIEPPGSTGTNVLRFAGVLIVVLGLISGLGQPNFFNLVTTIFISFVLAALLIAIAQVRDLSYDTWKKVNRIEEELTNRSRR